MVRTMLESLISDRCGKKGKSLRKELDVSHVEQIERFHSDSFYWPYLLNFSGNDSVFIQNSRFYCINVSLRHIAKVLRFISDVVSRVLLGNDNGEKNPSNSDRFFFNIK